MRIAFWTSCLLAAACAAISPRIHAEAPKAPPARAEDKPLIPAEIKDADLVKAIREYYTKYEYRIPMRDGVHLFTSVYVPKDRSRTYPILMNRTPYSATFYGVDHYPGSEDSQHLAGRIFAGEPFVRDGYIFVVQDVRGRFMSEGNFVDVRPRASKPGDIDESTDTYDTIDWMVKNIPANNGKVGMWGISYPGFYAAQGAIHAHPALKAVSPQAPVTDWFDGDDFHHHGAFMLGDCFDFYAIFGKARPKPVTKSPPRLEHDTADVYDYFLKMGALSNANGPSFLDGKIAFWNDLMQHGSRDDFWKARDPRPDYKNVKPAVMTVGGWFDAEDLFGALQTYRAFEKQSPGANNTLVMGPWAHGGWARSDGDHLGDISFGAKTAVFFREQIELPFFQRYLKGKQTAAPPEVWALETGTNMWQRYPAWPPAAAKSAFLAFQPNGQLGAGTPAKAADDGFDAYLSDPAKPVPYRDQLSDRMNHDYMIEDQRFAARRPDVLTYKTETLSEDVTLAGPLQADLWVSTTGTDADFIVKLIDVYPNDAPDPSPNPTNVRMGGYQQMVRAEVMRGKFRNSHEKPEPFKPGEPTEVRISIPDVSHTFRSGHRIMVQVQSTWFPLVDRNPQIFTDIYQAKDADFHAATHRIYHAPGMASGLTVSILRGKL